MSEVVDNHGSLTSASRGLGEPDASLPKWTPGPWKVIGMNSDGDRVIDKRTHNTIAAIRAPSNQMATIGNLAEELANANLIAAAPALYEALAGLSAAVKGLNELSEGVTTRADMDLWVDVDGAQKAAFAALALARGVSQ